MDPAPTEIYTLSLHDALPFAAAPAVVVRETGYTSWPSLRPHFWIPVYADAGPTGRFYGAFTAGTDALGRFVYGADVYVSGRPFRGAGRSEERRVGNAWR